MVSKSFSVSLLPNLFLIISGLEKTLWAVIFSELLWQKGMSQIFLVRSKNSAQLRTMSLKTMPASAEKSWEQ